MVRTVNEPKLQQGQKLKLHNLTGKEAERFKEGDIVTVKSQKAMFGKLMTYIEEHDKPIHVLSVQQRA